MLLGETFSLLIVCGMRDGRWSGRTREYARGEWFPFITIIVSLALMNIIPSEWNHKKSILTKYLMPSPDTGYIEPRRGRARIVTSGIRWNSRHLLTICKASCDAGSFIVRAFLHFSAKCHFITKAKQFASFSSLMHTENNEIMRNDTTSSVFGLHE